MKKRKLLNKTMQIKFQKLIQQEQMAMDRIHCKIINKTAIKTISRVINRETHKLMDRTDKDIIR